MRTKIAQSPNSWPQAYYIIDARKLYGGDNHTTCETKFVPRGKHTTLEIEAMGLLLGQSNLKSATFGCNRSRVVPFEIVGLFLNSDMFYATAWG